jgi:hypothetical protein
MPQAKSEHRLHQQLKSALGLVASLAMFNPAEAQELSSLYTPLDLKKCKDMTPPEAREYGTIWRCRAL